MFSNCLSGSSQVFVCWLRSRVFWNFPLIRICFTRVTFETILTELGLECQPDGNFELGFPESLFRKQCPFSEIAVHFLYNKISRNAFMSLIAELLVALRLRLDYQASVDRNRTGHVFRLLYRTIAGYPTLLVPRRRESILDVPVKGLPTGGDPSVRGLGSPTRDNWVWCRGGQAKLVPFSS